MIFPEDKKTVFVVIDMQEYFLSPESHAFIPSALAIIEEIRLFQKFCHQKKIPVIFTRHINSKQDTGLMRSWWKELIIEDNPLSRISPEFHTEGSLIIRKTQYDAFYRTDLDHILKKQNIRYIVFSGVMTNLCCETTARSAFVRGFQPYLPVDLCAAYNEQLHRNSIMNLAVGFCPPVVAHELKDHMEKW